MLKKLLALFSVVFFLILNTQAQLPDNLPLRLRVASYNMGHFNQGRLGGFQAEGKMVQAEMQNWKNWLGQANIDILGLNEWNKYFDKDSTIIAQDAILKPFYNHIHFGKETRWIYNGIATNYPLTNIRQVEWDGDYYAVLGDIVVGQKTITVISSHTPWQKDWHQGSLNALIDLLGQFEYFICMGDINASDAEQLRFVEAGFNMANGGHMGWFSTAAATTRVAGLKGGPNTNIDNIITSKNIKIMNISAPLTGLNDLDHLPIIADLIVTW